MRHRRGQNQAYPQSYPQFVWMGDWAIIGAIKFLWSADFVHHHTSGWLADLAPFDLLDRGLGLGHRTHDEPAPTLGGA